jgi:hypothetical protein
VDWERVVREGGVRSHSKKGQTYRQNGWVAVGIMGALEEPTKLYAEPSFFGWTEHGYTLVAGNGIQGVAGWRKGHMETGYSVNLTLDCANRTVTLSLEPQGENLKFTHRLPSSGPWRLYIILQKQGNCVELL